jgi:hypothetical protein
MTWKPDVVRTSDSGDVDALPEKVAPIGTDLIMIEDSADGDSKAKIQIANLPGGADADAIHDNVAGEIGAVAAKAAPVGGDFLLIEDSAAANIKKSATLTAIGDTLAGAGLTNTVGVLSVDAGADSTAVHDNVAGEIDAIAEKLVPIAGDFLIIEDSAAALVKKKVQIGNLPGGGGGGAATTKAVNQLTHGLAVGDWVRHSGAAYVKAQADSAANAEVVGVVSASSGVDDFTLMTGGYIDTLVGMAAGTVYFLDPSTAGAMTATEPSTTGQVSKPLMVGVSGTEGVLLTMRGILIGSQSDPLGLVIAGERILTGVVAYTVDASGTDHMLLCDALLGTVTVTLPAAPATGREIVLKDATGSATTNNIVIQQSAAETIDSANSVTLTVNYQSLTLRANADGNWSLI